MINQLRGQNTLPTANKIMSEEKLTPEQIENWRNVIPHIFGIPGDALSDEDVQKLRDNMQNMANMTALELAEIEANDE